MSKSKYEFLSRNRAKLVRGDKETLDLYNKHWTLPSNYSSLPQSRSEFERYKITATKRVYSAKRNGTLVPQPCERCGVIKVDAHHEDYSKPLEVVWLCKKHHAERHRELGWGFIYPQQTFAS